MRPAPRTLKVLTLSSASIPMEDQMTNSSFLDWVSLLLRADHQISLEEHMSTSSKRPTKPRGKAKLTEEEMKYKYQRVRMPESQAECNMDVRDSELGHIDIEEFWVRTQKVTRSPWMDKLIGSALHFAGGIPVSAVNNEFMMVVAQSFNKDTRCVENSKGEVVINLTARRFELMLGIPHHRNYVAVSQQECIKAWEDNEDQCMQLMNEVYLKNKKVVTRWPQTIHRSDFSEELSDTITFLSRVFGLSDAHYFHKWMLRYLETMNKNLPDQRFCWGEIISSTISEQLQQFATTGVFHMNSYVVYAAAAERDYPGLHRSGTWPQAKIYEYYQELKLENSIQHFAKINDVFFYHIMCMLRPNLTHGRTTKNIVAAQRSGGPCSPSFPRSPI
ncbi:hypothetical protein KI387_021821 [Taxus chinensis]|uniref:Uncharacterized protein n=6 Tax=Taxus chinensis TaxID=29808 RepID=A0AA38GB05_TAXCH|nr:hypothetical protein KI387_021821 [Taxus chinensis]